MMKPTRVRLLVLIVAVLSAQGALIYAYLRSGLPPEPRADQGRRPPSSQSSRRDGGMPVARQRLDTFITKVAGYDFEQCAAALHEPASEGIDIVQVVGMQSSDPSPSLRFKTVLADRRVAKLYGWLAEMPPDAAAARAAALFDEKLAIHEAACRGFATDTRLQAEERLETLPEEARTVDSQYRSMLRNNHALSAALFLSAAFCKPTVVLENVDCWNRTMLPISQEFDGVLEALRAWMPTVAFPAMEYILPEKLFVLNVYALSYDRHGCGPVERLLAAVERREPHFVKNSFYAWDADINDSDFLHVHGMVPAADTKVLTHVWMARTWGVMLSFDEAKQDEILAAARARLEECAGISSDPPGR